MMMKKEQVTSRSYIVRPLQFVERRIGADVTFNVEVVAFLDVVSVDVAAQRYAHLRRI